MSSALTIRPANESDLTAILAITNEVIANTTAIYAFQPQSVEERARWFHDLTAGGWPVIVAVEAGEVTGFGSIGVFRTRPGYKYTGEHSVHVHADHRGKGVGRALLQALIHEAERMELRAIVGGIDAENLVSLKLHADLGFVETARMPNMAWKFGRWLTLVFMQLTLSGPRTPQEQ